MHIILAQLCPVRQGKDDRVVERAQLQVEPQPQGLVTVLYEAGQTESSTVLQDFFTTEDFGA